MSCQRCYTGSCADHKTTDLEKNPLCRFESKNTRGFNGSVPGAPEVPYSGQWGAFSKLNPSEIREWGGKSEGSCPVKCEMDGGRCKSSYENGVVDSLYQCYLGDWGDDDDAAYVCTHNRYGTRNSSGALVKHASNAACRGYNRPEEPTVLYRRKEDAQYGNIGPYGPNEYNGDGRKKARNDRQDGGMVWSVNKDGTINRWDQCDEKAVHHASANPKEFYRGPQDVVHMPLDEWWKKHVNDASFTVSDPSRKYVHSDDCATHVYPKMCEDYKEIVEHFGTGLESENPMARTSGCRAWIQEQLDKPSSKQVMDDAGTRLAAAALDKACLQAEIDFAIESTAAKTPVKTPKFGALVAFGGNAFTEAHIDALEAISPKWLLFAEGKEHRGMSWDFVRERIFSVKPRLDTIASGPWIYRASESPPENATSYKEYVDRHLDFDSNPDPPFKIEGKDSHGKAAFLVALLPHKTIRRDKGSTPVDLLFRGLSAEGIPEYNFKGHNGKITVTAVKTWYCSDIQGVRTVKFSSSHGRNEDGGWAQGVPETYLWEPVQTAAEVAVKFCREIATTRAGKYGASMPKYVEHTCVTKGTKDRLKHPDILWRTENGKPDGKQNVNYHPVCASFVASDEGGTVGDYNSHFDRSNKLKWNIMTMHCENEKHKQDNKCACFYDLTDSEEWKREQATRHVQESSLEGAFKDALLGKLNFFPPMCFVDACVKDGYKTKKLVDERERGCPTCLNFNAVKGPHKGSKITQRNSCGDPALIDKINDAFTVDDTKDADNVGNNFWLELKQLPVSALVTLGIAAVLVLLLLVLVLAKIFRKRRRFSKNYKKI